MKRVSYLEVDRYVNNILEVDRYVSNIDVKTPPSLPSLFTLLSKFDLIYIRWF